MCATAARPLSNGNDDTPGCRDATSKPQCTSKRPLLRSVIGAVIIIIGAAELLMLSLSLIIIIGDTLRRF